MKALPTQPQVQQGGFTLVEQLVALAVSAVAASTALPAAEAFMQRKALEGTASMLRTDLHYARSAAIAMHAGVRFKTEHGEHGTCYIIHTGASDACTCTVQAGARNGSAAATCTTEGQLLRVVGLPAANGLVINANSKTMLFDSTLGTVTPTGTLQVVNQRGEAVHAVINIMGRVRQCSPSPVLKQYPKC
jgi:type IV fimbrial biogenesis protein FimT